MRVTIILLLTLLSTPVFADEPTIREKAICTPDAIKFCYHLKTHKDDPSIASQLISCLMNNKSSLRPACQAVLTKHGI